MIRLDNSLGSHGDTRKPNKHLSPLLLEPTWRSWLLEDQAKEGKLYQEPAEQSSVPGEQGKRADHREESLYNT